DVEQVHASCRIDRWFLEQIKDIIDHEERIKAHGLPKTTAQMRGLKAMGFSDARLGKLAGVCEQDVRAHRAQLNVHPVFKRIDTCAAEFAAPTAYMYSTYETGLIGEPACEANPSGAQKVVILGG